MSINNKSNLNLTKGYDPNTAKTLAACLDLVYGQYANNKENPLVELPGYKQTAALYAAEIPVMKNEVIEQLGDLEKIDLTDLPGLKKMIKSLKLGQKEVYFGSVLESTYEPRHFIVALRGTMTLYEMKEDVVFLQKAVSPAWFTPGDVKNVRAHIGFLIIYALLVDQIKHALTELNAEAGFITGHSLGGALAILAAATIGTIIHPDKGIDGSIQMYNFGGPRLGNKSFKDAYDPQLPYSYRVTNLADACPIVPPEEIPDKIPLEYDYTHVGKEFSYLWQTYDIFANHDLTGNYLPAVNQEVPTDKPRTYPCPGI
ncbi:MAG: triacylglycerol lipase [Acidobacteriota bacterium]|nr:triacylglycerol lipase [Acidobacteriota bacterium]